MQFIKDNFLINDCESLFHKRKGYEEQNEYRIVVQNYFKQLQSAKNYDYRKNELTVEMPCLQDYSQIWSAKELKFLNFYKPKNPT